MSENYTDIHPNVINLLTKLLPRPMSSIMAGLGWASKKVFESSALKQLKLHFIAEFPDQFDLYGEYIEKKCCEKQIVLGGNFLQPSVFHVNHFVAITDCKP